jgi:hypothetical protein
MCENNIDCKSQADPVANRRLTFEKTVGFPFNSSSNSPQSKSNSNLIETSVFISAFPYESCEKKEM